MIIRKLVTLCIAGTLALSGAHLFAAEPLRIGVEGAYPPFSRKEADGSLSGFDIEIAEALCKQMGRKCTLVEQEWDGMIPALIARKFDAIIASMSITDDRRKKVGFSEKYYATPTRFIARKGSDLELTASGLEGKKIGLLRGTTYQCFVEKHFPDADIMLYNTQEDVYADLVTGRLDAQVSNSIQAMDGLLNTEAGKDFAFIGDDLDDEACLGEGIGIAVRKNDRALADEFSGAIKAIRENGAYQAVNDKYFAIDIYGN